jgi:ATP-dependent DNA helicase RecQ
VKEKTILSNLKKFVDDGHQIDPTEVLAASSLSERKKDEVYEAMEEVGPKLLRPIYDKLNKTVDYNELRVLQLAYIAMNGD